LLYLPIKQKQIAMETSIKVGYDSQTGFYTFNLGYYNFADMKVNGKSLINPLTGVVKQGELYVISEKPETISYSRTATDCTGYTHVETGTVITKEEYNEMQAEINASRTYDEDSEEFIYDEVEDEVKAIRFYRAYKPLYENVKTEYKYNLEIELIQYPVSAYKNIVPLYSLDAKNVFETRCEYLPDTIELFYEICAQYGIDKTRVDVPNHSNLRYAKIDDTYLTGMEEFEKSVNSTGMIGTYDECVTKMNSTRKRLEDVVSLHLAKRSQKLLDKGTVGELLKELLALKNRVLGLDVKQKDYSSLRALTTKITELIETYTQLA
jgi:hypothetical protein